jgi:hypothetical protein
MVLARPAGDGAGMTTRPEDITAMDDPAATFDAHVQAEFQDLDLEATMATMTGDPYVHHVPTITGGNGIADPAPNRLGERVDHQAGRDAHGISAGTRSSPAVPLRRSSRLRNGGLNE